MMTEDNFSLPPSRRNLLQALAVVGIGSVAFQRALAATADKPKGITVEMIQHAEWISGIRLSDEDRKTLAESLNRQQKQFETMRAFKVAHEVPPAISFNPTPWLSPSCKPVRRAAEPIVRATPKKPDAGEDLAFLPVTALAALVRTRQVSSVELTKLYLERLRKYDPMLHCVVSYTEDVALKQAEQADREIAAGRYRGPLHGIPWGAKDLIAYPGYKTTWGATPFKEQTIDAKATVARRLEEAGAVLVAKLTTGTLAMGDYWFGGRTRNPWDPRRGASGSSAGPAAATAAGLVGFAIGSETMGSIISPARTCGIAGLRPTFGRVSRYGCMTLSWSMDKLGPLCRSVEDCALVLAAIHGFDGLDPSALDRPFAWPPARDLRTLRVGYIQKEGTINEREELRVLRDLGVRLVPIKLPTDDDYPIDALNVIFETEAATIFDELTRKGITEGLNLWPNIFRKAQFVPAVEYLRANRIRTLLMRTMEEVMTTVDLYVGGSDLLLENLTGHPTIAVPSGFRKKGDMELPAALAFTGRLYGETDLLAVAHAYQQATGHHLRRPPLDKHQLEKAYEGYITTWLLLAPIPLEKGQSGADALNKEQLKNEAKLQPKAGDKVKAGGKELVWKTYRAKDYYFDFNDFLGKETEDSVGYAVCYIRADAEMKDIMLKAGSDDQVKVYLNGKEVHKHEQGRPLEPDEDSSKITLHKGVNVLVFKVVNGKVEWSGCARFVDKDGKVIKGLKVTTTPNYTSRGPQRDIAAVLRIARRRGN
jgi:Asp-tRNA(Asn)/Glu-tRNA(Gln) amidotransferase A subunit family amidase